MRIEFIFDYRSPYSYLANTQLKGLGADVDYKPVDIVAVMKKVNNQPSPLCPPKARYAGIDAARWARLYADHKAVSAGFTYLHLAGILVGGGFAVAADRAALRLSPERGPDWSRDLASLTTAGRQQPQGPLPARVVAGIRGWLRTSSTPTPGKKLLSRLQAFGIRGPCLWASTS